MAFKTYRWWKCEVCGDIGQYSRGITRIICSGGPKVVRQPRGPNAIQYLPHHEPTPRVEVTALMRHLMKGGEDEEESSPREGDARTAGLRRDLSRTDDLDSDDGREPVLDRPDSRDDPVPDGVRQHQLDLGMEG